ncbi:MAG TPA: HNH endonuclease signature motif containing protein [Verrucomicrobiae bacterium]
MSGALISATLRAAVRERAAKSCEYCRMPEIATFFPHEPDHVIGTQHGGHSTLDNLALACAQCNRIKGPNIASVDPQTQQIVPLFNPRMEKWTDHFRMEAGRIVPMTAPARATARLLRFDQPERQEARQNLWRAGRLSG